MKQNRNLVGARALGALVLGVAIFFIRTAVVEKQLQPATTATTATTAAEASRSPRTVADVTAPMVERESEPKTEREAAAAFLAELRAAFPFGRERQAALRSAMDGVPAEGIEVLLRLTFGDDELNDISHVLIERLAELSPEAALAFGREMGFGAEPPWWHSVIGGLADPRGVMEDVLALPESAVRTGYIGHAAQRLALTEPQAALDFAFLDAPPEARETAVANAVIGVGRADPAEGFELALQLHETHGETPVDGGLLHSIALDWSMNDPAAASRRIMAMEPGAARQVALTTLAKAAVGRDHREALALAAHVEDAAARAEVVLQAAVEFYMKEPTHAEGWLGRTSDLTPEQKRYVREFYAFSHRKPEGSASRE